MEWIGIKDKLPPKNDEVLVTNGVIVTAAELNWLNGKPCYWDGYGLFDECGVTHWMPLPPPPKP